MTKKNERDSMNPNDDVWSALANNTPSTFSVGEIDSIVAEVPGENDELTWWWVLRVRPAGAVRPKYVLLSGSCDYTGWDCRSGIDEHGIFHTSVKAAQAAPEMDAGRPVRDSLIGQIKGTEPFGTTTIDYRGGY